MAIKTQLLSFNEIDKLKSIVNGKWDIMQEKVDNLGKEVFEDVMEHEMALAKLETVNFEKSSNVT